jgi:hypothetical protein
MVKTKELEEDMILSDIQIFYPQLLSPESLQESYSSGM